LVEEHIGNFIKDYELGDKIYEYREMDFFELQYTKGKKSLLLEFKKNPIFVKDRLTAFIFIFSDTTSIKDMISDLSFLATHDFLTGISNRMNFMKLADAELYRIMRYGGEFALVMIDIDFFKKINDTYGHICGDEVLRDLTELIKKNLRALDIFARIGGEEFCILLPNTTINNAEKFCEKIRILVEETPFLFNKIEVYITISLGLTYYSEEMPQIPFEELLDLADKALYISKEHGRNRTSTLHLSMKE